MPMLPSPRLRALFFLAFASLSVASAEAAVWHVGPDGDDVNSGTGPAEAFGTLAHAVAQLAPGDTLVLQEGVYRETLEVTVPGTAADPITIRAAGTDAEPEAVTISGFDEVVPGSAGVGPWTVHAGAIWKIQLGAQAGTALGRNLVKVDGTVLFPARWPDIERLPGFDRRAMAEAGSGSVDTTSMGSLDDALAGIVPAYGWTDFYTGGYEDEALSGFAAGSWKGAHIDLCAGHNWWAKTGVVTGNSADSLAFQYRFADDWDPVLDTPKEGDRYALWGHLQALDSPGEFFFDVHGLNGPAKTLYVWLPGGGSPEGRQVELLERERSVHFGSHRHIHIRDLTVEGGAVESQPGSSDLVLDGVTVRFGAVNRNGLDYGSGRAVWLKGDRHHFLNGRVGPSFKRTLEVVGEGTVVENNVLHDAAEHLLTLSGAVNGTFRRNTGYRAGNTAADIGASGSLIERNHLYHAGMRITDVATMNTWNGGDLGGTEIRYNWVHSNLAPWDGSRSWWGGQGIRLDSGSAALGCSNARIHHNVVWGTTSESSITVWGLQEGMLNFGDAMVKVYHNTVDDHLVLGGDGSVAGNDWRRNIARAFNNATGGLEGATVEENHFLTTEMAGNWTGNPGFVSPVNRNYQLGPASPARDAGTPVPGYSESGPEAYLGAYNPAATPWRPGALARTRDLAGLTAEVVTEADGAIKLRVSGLPQGRSFPESFAVRVDGTVLANPIVRYSFSDHLAEVVIEADPSSLAGPGLVEVSLDGSAFVPLGENLDVPLRAITGVTAAYSGAEGGTAHELRVEGIRGLFAERRPLDFRNLREGDFRDQPVPWLVDTGAWVADGMAPDGSDLRFHAWDGVTPVDHYLASGIGKANTLLWMMEDAASSAETDIASFEDRSLLYLSYGDPMRTDASDPLLLERGVPALGSPDLLLHLRANRLADSHAAGDPVQIWPHPANPAYSAVQADPAKRPLFLPDSMGGLPALRFDGLDDVLDVNGAEGLGTGPGRFFVVYRNPEPTATMWQRLFSARASTDMLDYVDGLYAIVENDTGTALPLTDPFLREMNFPGEASRRNFRIGGRSLSADRERFGGEMAELIGFDGGLTGEPREELLLYLRRKYGIVDRPEALFPSVGAIPALQVFVGGNPATGSHWKEEGTIGFTAPAYTGEGPLPAMVDITVVTADGESVVLSEAFLYRSAYQEWQAGYFGETALADPSLEAGLWGDAADPDGDGVANLREFATGTDPLAAFSARRPVGKLVGGRLHLSFYRARADTGYLIQGSNDLQGWETVSTNPGAVGEWVEVPDASTLAEAPGGVRFLRLRVVDPAMLP